MSDPSKRFLTVVLALGVVVLIAAIAVGQRMGDRVLGQITEKRLESIAPVTVTPAPATSDSGPYNPNWRREQVLAAAADPGFADPRVPPVPLPTAAPTPKSTPVPKAKAAPTPTPTPNLNLPVWRRAAPLPTATPAGESPSPGASGSGQPAASPEPKKTDEPKAADQP